MANYRDCLNKIEASDSRFQEKAWEHLNMLAKPPKSLGKLEEIAAKLCAIDRTLSPNIDKRCIIVLASDNGVVAEGVALAPQEVTAIQTINIAHGITGVGVLAKHFHTDLMVADIGVNADLRDSKIIDRKIRKSTGNIAVEPAMTQEEAEKAVDIGFELACQAKEQGYQLIGVGEMGIGNTTTSSAVLSALLRIDDVAKVTGRGAGLDDASYGKKVDVIKNALLLHKPNPDNPIDVLKKVGGLDLAAMTGVYLGAAYCGLPVVIDGFISSVAALCATRLCPTVKDYLFASHHSFECGYALAMEALEMKACLNLDMRLGEGSGCPLMFAMMDAALAIFREMGTFKDAEIDDRYLEGIKEIGDKAF